jgi:DDE superfamily endonuclease
MAKAIRIGRVIGINKPSITYVSYDVIADQWVGRFIMRHLELQSIMAEQIEATRIKETSSRPVLEKWFTDVKSIIDEFNIKQKNIYNMDETGCSIGSIKATGVIIDQTANIRYLTYLGRQEWVSAIECISMDDTFLTPLVIFKGKTLTSHWLPSNTPMDWFFSCNKEG